MKSIIVLFILGCVASIMISCIITGCTDRRGESLCDNLERATESDDLVYLSNYSDFSVNRECFFGDDGPRHLIFNFVADTEGDIKQLQTDSIFNLLLSTEVENIALTTKELSMFRELVNNQELKSLTIHCQRFDMEGLSFCKFPRLERLFISSAYTLPLDRLCFPSTIKELTLGGNYSVLPKNIFEIDSLHSISLWNSKLTNIDVPISQIPQKFLKINLSMSKLKKAAERRENWATQRVDSLKKLSKNVSFVF